VSPDAFRRLALLTAGTLYAFGLVLAWRFVIGLGAAFAVFIFGAAIAILVTLEQRPDEPEDEKPEREGMSRREIARRTAHEEAE
jgi:hypothetical protein